MDVDQSISISDDDDNTEEAKIIKEAERKISKAMFIHISIKDLPCLLAENLKKKTWRSVVYAFYKEQLNVVRKDNRKKVQTTYLEFTCLKCSTSYLQGTGTDSGSTGVMHDHIPLCWDKDIWNEAKNLDLDPAKDVIKKFKYMKNVKLTEMFVCVPGSKETYSTTPPLCEEIWYIILPTSSSFFR